MMRSSLLTRAMAAALLSATSACGWGQLFSADGAACEADLHCPYEQVCCDGACRETCSFDPGAGREQIVLSGQSVVAPGTCAAYAVALRDTATGAARPLPSGVRLRLSRSGEGETYEDAQCDQRAEVIDGAAAFYFASARRGRASLHVAAEGFLSGTLQLEIGSSSGPPSGLALIAPQLTGAGACTPISVALLGPDERPAVVTSSQVVPATASRGALYSDAACGVLTQHAVIASGAASATIFFRETTAGEVALSASTVAQGNASARLEVRGLPASHFFIEAPASANVGEDVTVRVIAADAYRNVDTGESRDLVLVVAAGGTGAGLVDLVDGVGTTLVANERAVPTPLSLADTQGTGLDVSDVVIIDMLPGAPAAVGLSGPLAAAAGECVGPYAVVVRDVYGNETVTPGALLASLASDRAAQFSATSSCSTFTSSVTVEAGLSRADVWLRATDSGAHVLAVTAASLSGGTLDVAVSAGSPVRASIAGPSAATAGSCAGPFEIHLFDAFDNASAASVSSTALLADDGAGQIYADAGCASPASSVEMTAGAASASFWYRSTDAALVTVTADLSGMPSPTHELFVTEAPPAAIVLTGPDEVTASVCVALTVTVTDMFSNVTPLASGGSVTLGASPVGSAAFYSDGACTAAASVVALAPGEASALLYVRLSAASTLSAASVGLASGALSIALSGATGPATHWTVSGPSVVLAGACAAFDVSTRDAGERPVPPASDATATVQVSAGTLYSDASCTSATSSVIVGSSQTSRTVWLRHTTAGPATLTASGGSLTSGALALQVRGRPATRFAILPVAPGVVGVPMEITVDAADEYANRDTSFTGSVTLVVGGSATGGGLVALAAGRGRRSIQDTVAESVLVTLTDPQPASVDAGEARTVVFQPGPAAVLELSGPTTAKAGDCTTFTVRRLDSYGNEVTGGGAISVALSAGNGGFFTTTCSGGTTSQVTLPLGAASVTFRHRSTVTGSTVVSVSSPAVPTGDSSMLTISAGDPASLAFVTAPSPVTAGACAAYAVQTRDAFGNEAPVASSLSLALGHVAGGAGVFYADAACSQTTSAAIVAAGASGATFYYRNTTAETVQLGVTSSLPLASANVVVNPAAATRVAVIGDATIGNGVCTSYLVRTRDPFGNTAPLAQATVFTLSDSGSGGTFGAGCSAAMTQVTISGGQSQATFYYQDDVQETATLSAAASGFTSEPLQVTSSSGPPSRLRLTGTTSLGAGTCGQYTITSTDDQGASSRVTSSINVTLASGGAGQFWDDTGCVNNAITQTTIAANTAQRVVGFVHTTAGPVTLQASTTAAGFTQNGSLPISIVAGAPSVVSVQGPQQITLGECAPFSVDVLDSWGNQATLGAARTVTLSGQQSGAFYANSSCTVGLTSNQLALGAGASSEGFFYRNESEQTVTLQVSASGTPALSGQSRQVTVAAPPFPVVGRFASWLDVAIDRTQNQVLYASQVEGATYMVYRSSDAGASWVAQCKGGTHGGYIATALRASPGSDRRVYFATHNTLFRVEPLAGGDCPRISTGTDFSSYFHVPSFDVAPDGTVFMAERITGGMRLQRSTNGGASWTTIYTDTTVTAYGGAVAISPADPSLILMHRVTSGSGAGLYRSTNAGVSFTLVPSVSWASVSSYGELLFDPTRALGASIAGGYATADGGLTWTTGGGYSTGGNWAVGADGAGYRLNAAAGSIDVQRAPSLASPVWSSLASLAPGSGIPNERDLDVAGGTIAAVVAGRLYVSTNGGTSFQRAADLMVSSLDISSIDTLDGETLFAVTRNWQVAKSVDGGTSWTVIDPPLLNITSGPPRVRIHPAITDSSRVLVFADNYSGSTYQDRMFVAQDGATFTEVTGMSSWATAFAYSVASATADRMYIFSNSARESLTGGASWQNGVNPSPAFGFVWYPFLDNYVSPANADIAWVGEQGSGGVLWEYNRSNATKVDITSRLSTGFGGAFAPAGLHMYQDGATFRMRVVSTTGQILQSSNNATTFATVGSGVYPSSATCSRALISSSPSDRSFIAVGCAGVDQILTTRDTGSSWRRTLVSGCGVRSVNVVDGAVIVACSTRGPVQIDVP